MTRKRKVQPWKKRKIDQLLTRVERDLSTGNTQQIWTEFFGKIDVKPAYPLSMPKTSGVKDLTPDEIQHININDLAIGGRIEMDAHNDHKSLAEQQRQNDQPGISSG